MVNEESGTSKRRRAPLIYPRPATPLTRMSSQFITQVKTVPVSRRRLTRIGNRYLIQLPMQLNDLWSYLHENNAVLNLVVEVVSLNPKKTKQVTKP